MKNLILFALIALLSGCAYYKAQQQFDEYERQLQIAHARGQISDLEYSQRIYELNRDREIQREAYQRGLMAATSNIQTQQYQQQQLAMQQEQVNMQKWQGIVPAPLAAAGYVPAGSDE